MHVKPAPRKNQAVPRGFTDGNSTNIKISGGRNTRDGAIKQERARTASMETGHK